jgi:hypothetical protein
MAKIRETKGDIGILVDLNRPGTSRKPSASVGITLGHGPRLIKAIPALRRLDEPIGIPM